MREATHVTITKANGSLSNGGNESETYMIQEHGGGMSRGGEYGCVRNGLVHRVCARPSGGANNGSGLLAHGEHLRFHMGDKT